MSAARLIVIKDHGEKIHVSRSMPAALEGLVSSDDFGVFCDKLDSSLQLLEAQEMGTKRQPNRCSCFLLIITIIVFHLWFFWDYQCKIREMTTTTDLRRCFWLVSSGLSGFRFTFG